MKQDDFEKIMGDWAARLLRSARGLRPTAEMYRLVSEKGRKRIWSPLFTRWVLVATAAASLVVAALIYAALQRFVAPIDTLTTVAFDAIGQREGFAVESRTGPKGARGKGMPGDKKRKVESPGFISLRLQIQKQDEVEVATVDVLARGEGPIVLTSRENYRLTFQPVEDCYVYIYQLTSEGLLVRLLPNATYSPVDNPFAREMTYYVPARPKWLYLGETKGEERVYIIGSQSPLPQLEALYAQYVRADDLGARRGVLDRMLSRLEGIVEGLEPDAAGWAVGISHQ